MAKILIVEDDKLLRKLFGKRFREAGHQVFEADNGLQGLELGNDESPDAVILDYQMPVLDGSKMLKQLRQSWWGRNIQVILVTAASTTELIPNLELADLILHKPIEVQELTSLVLRLIRQNEVSV